MLPYWNDVNSVSHKIMPSPHNLKREKKTEFINKSSQYLFKIMNRDVYSTDC